MAERTYPGPSVIRSQLVLEVASGMVGDLNGLVNNATAELHSTSNGVPSFSMASQTGQSLCEKVANGQLHVAIANPSAMLTLAVRGIEPFERPLPLRVLSVLPSHDQVAFAVRCDEELNYVEEIAERRLPLRISVRGAKDHGVHAIMTQIFSACNFSIADLTEWGGVLSYDEGMPGTPNRIGSVEAGLKNALFDESAHNWVGRALTSGLQVLGLRQETMERLESVGLRRAILSHDDYPGLGQDRLTVDFSGWTLYVHADAPEAFVVAFCAALNARRDRIPWQGNGPLPVDTMCVDTPSTPFDVPLHSAAERYWHSLGYR